MACCHTTTSLQKGSRITPGAYLQQKCHQNLVSVVRRLEWLAIANTNVVGLLFGELSEVGTECRKVQHGHLLVKELGKKVKLVLISQLLLPVVQEINLGKSLVGERARHHEMQQTPPSQRTSAPLSSTCCFVS